MNQYAGIFGFVVLTRIKDLMWCALIGLKPMAISKSANTYNRQNWEESVSFRLM